MSTLIDRLIHHGEVYYLEGDSYRMQGKENLLNGEDLGSRDQTSTKDSAGKEKRTESSEN